MGYDGWFPSCETTGGKLFWAGVFGIVSFSFAVSAAWGRR